MTTLGTRAMRKEIKVAACQASGNGKRHARLFDAVNGTEAASGNAGFNHDKLVDLVADVSEHGFVGS